MTLPNVKAIAQEYIAKSNVVDYDGMADLFDEDAEWVPISPMEPRRGREAIRAGYLEHIKNKNRPIVRARFYADGLTCVAEFDVELENGSYAAIVDIFTFNGAGKIVRLSVYRK